jgi:hypothetical protein
LNPLELVSLTPKTNCGQCGYPACLAFAVAVTKGGISPSGCPFIDPASLPPELCGDNERDGLDAVDKGQDERDMALVAHLKSKIKPLDFIQLAVKLGADCSQDVLSFPYLGRPVELGRERLRLDAQELVDPRDQILLYNYVSFGGSNAPDNIWVGMESLPNSISKIRTLATYCELRLAEKFAGRGERLQELCTLTGGVPGPADQSGDVGMIIPVLPYVPLYLLFWDEEPEDGFEAKVKVLFDHHVMDFLDLESLVFAAERLADRLAELDQV